METGVFSVTTCVNGAGGLQATKPASPLVPSHVQTWWCEDAGSPGRGAPASRAQRCIQTESDT